MATRVHTLWLLATLLVCVAPTAAFHPARDIEATIDSLYETAGEVNWITLASDSPSVYVGASFRTFAHPFERVKKAILDFDSYGESFKYVRAFLPLPADSVEHPRPYEAYFELGTHLYRVWALARVESIDSSTDGSLRVRISRIDDRDRNGQWRDAPKGGLIAVGADLFSLRWYCRRAGPRRTRAGFVAWLSPTVTLPRWVLRFAYRAFVPRFLQEVGYRLESRR